MKGLVMKKLLAGVFLITLFLTIPAVSSMSNYSGIWYGVGTLKSSKGNLLQCEFDLDIRQSDKKVEFGKFVYTCNGYSFAYNPPTLTIKNKKHIYWGDQKVGELGKDKTKLVFKRENGSLANYTVELTDKYTLIYENAQMYADGGFQILNASLGRMNPDK